LGLKKVFARHYPANSLKHKAGMMARFTAPRETEVFFAARRVRLKAFYAAQPHGVLSIVVLQYRTKLDLSIEASAKLEALHGFSFLPAPPRLTMPVA